MTQNVFAAVAALEPALPEMRAASEPTFSGRPCPHGALTPRGRTDPLRCRAVIEEYVLDCIVGGRQLMRRNWNTYSP